MPKFVKAGPVVPDELVQALEDDRVVIFCGAGISMGAGLPSYEGLVRFCYGELAEPLPAKKSTEWLWPDRMLGSLEGRFGRALVREIVHSCLSTSPTTLEMHEAILRLAKLRGETGVRLVTTNFDTLFEQASDQWQLGRNLHSGPVLPIPRNDKAVTWRSVVYLHGRLDDGGANDHLVLTSADFGRSYLTDAWAARFVARLFSDFTVLFIGYSLNDPVLRYMTDAFAAENSSSRVASRRSPAYIFVPTKGKSEPDDSQYRHRHLRPIFYRQTKDHRHLRNTIFEWANAREDYLKSTSRLIARIAPKKPSSITPSDAANLVWAVCGRPTDGGHGAKVFADLKTRPPIEWLDEFDRRDRHLLESHKEAVEAAREDGEEPPSHPQLVIEPLFPRERAEGEVQIAPQSAHLARWLAEHVDEYGFAARVLKRIGNGRRIHPLLVYQIRRAHREKNQIKPGLARLWALITSTSGDILSLGRRYPFDLKVPETFDPANGNLAFKVDLLSTLRPYVSLSQPFETRLPDFDPAADGEEEARGMRLSEVADAKVVIPGDIHVTQLVDRILERSGSGQFLSSLLPELTGLLRRTSDLFGLTAQTSAGTDSSVFHRPSIAPHAQNRGHEKWTVLITMIWRAWQQTDSDNPASSIRYLEEWITSGRAIFRRLGLAALKDARGLESQEKMEHLLSDETQLLWDVSLRKEVYDLLVALWPRLSDVDRTVLVDRIAHGAPQGIAGHVIEQDRAQLIDRRVFERLQLMRRADPDRVHAGLEAHIARLRERYPQWEIAEGDQAHFSFYSRSAWRTLDAVDDGRRLQSMDASEITDELTHHRGEDTLDAWREIVASDWQRMVDVLSGVADQQGIDADLWTATLWGLRTKAASAKPGESVLELISGIDEAVVRDPKVAAAAAYVLESAASSSEFEEMQEAEFWRAFDWIAPGVAEDEANARSPVDRDWVGVAINTSMGNLALAFLNALFARRPLVGGGIPADLTDRFIWLMGRGEPRYRPARVVFGSRLSYLFAIDPDLIRRHLLGYFRWEHHELEAVAVWQGFGWQPHLDPLLWREIRADFLDCFQEDRIEQLGDAIGPLAQALAAAGLHMGRDDLPRQTMQDAIRRMSSDTRASMLRWIAAALSRADDGAVDPDAVWKEKVKPWILRFWPRERKMTQGADARPWVEMALATAESFDDAVATVTQFFRRGENNFTLSELAQSRHLSLHPRSSLKLLDALVSEGDQFWAFEDLRRVLDGVSTADGALLNDPTFVRWDAFARARS